jgi:lipopolysaccharide biosynthesis protein
MRALRLAALRSRMSVARAMVLSARTGLADWRRRHRPRAACDFEDWVGRRAQRGGGFPDAWRAHPGLPFAQPARVAVLLHVFYPELVEQLLGRLRALPVAFDLIVTDATGSELRPDLTGLPRLRNHVVLPVENRGRDLWPAVQVVNAGLLDPYELVLKVHTKRSPWRADHPVLSGTGDEWRQSLLDGLLADVEQVQRLLDAFAAEPDLGIVTADGTIAGPEHWGGDLDNTGTLLRRVELTVDRRHLRFAAGSCYWTRAFVLQGLRSLRMSAEDFEDEDGRADGGTAHALERAIGLLTTEAGLRIAGSAEVTGSGPAGVGWRRFEPDAPRRPRARVVPFYLPQFHPTPENEQWWGTGFTEWTNVTAAMPTFLGHNQPNLPAELGFYDLRLDDVRAAQRDLAAQHGIAGLMYYYYWFAGKRLLELPIEQLAASALDQPFCLMWANENWTRRWDGRSDDVLIGQDYDRVPATTFIDDVLPLLRDPRYLRVDGRPVLAVYRIGQIPDYASVIDHWRKRAISAGVGDLFVLCVDVARDFDGLRGAVARAGLDGVLGFPPHGLPWDWVPRGGHRLDRRFAGRLLSYQALARTAERRLLRQGADTYPAAMVGFDNTPRRQWEPDLWYGANPYTFRRWLASACSAVADREPDRRLVFVNAWNEWAEGAVLEPSRRFGRTYLQAVRDVLYA